MDSEDYELNLIAQLRASQDAVQAEAAAAIASLMAAGARYEPRARERKPIQEGIDQASGLLHLARQQPELRGPLTSAAQTLVRLARIAADLQRQVPVTTPSRLDDVRRAAEMTAACQEVDYAWRAPEGTRYAARLWCNAKGEPVIGYGPDTWTAVQAAHALCASETAQRGL